MPATPDTVPPSANAPASPVPVVRTLAAGDGWCVEEVVCRAGPGDRAFEERHGWTSIAAVMAGHFVYRTGQGRALLAPGALLLGNAGHCFECGHDHGTGDRCIAFRFAPALVEEVARDAAPGGGDRFHAAALPPIDRLVPLIGAVRALGASTDPLHAETVALGVLARAFALDRDTEEAIPGARDFRAAADAARLIESDYAQPLSIADLAIATRTPRRRLTLAFRRALGLTPYQYLLSRRLDAAAERLRASNETVLAIALDTGFGDLSEFTRRFGDRFGCPPAAFRAQSQLLRRKR